LFKYTKQALLPLRSYNFTLLWLGQTISLLGDQTYSIALIWLITGWTHSTVLLSTLLTVGYLPTIFFLIIGGAWTDAHNPKKIIFWSDLLRMVVTLGIAYW